MSPLFWLSDDAWAAIEPHLPKNQPGARRVDDRRVISGILHVLKTGCRCQDCPTEYGPPTTIYNRFNRWSGRQRWTDMLDALVAKGVLALSASIDSSYVKAHRPAHGGKGGEGAGHRPVARRPDHQDPCRDGPDWPPGHSAADGGNVADVTMAGPLMDAAGRVRCLIADKATTPTRCANAYMLKVPRQSFPGARTGRCRSTTTRSATRAAGASRPPFAD
jgi:transposase